MTNLTDKQIEDAFARIRVKFEKRKNETGLEILDGYEGQWEATGSLSRRNARTFVCVSMQNPECKHVFRTFRKHHMVIGNFCDAVQKRPTINRMWPRIGRI